MNIFLLLLGFAFFFTMSSCKSSCPACDAGYDTINTYAKKMHKQNDWYLYSIGGSFDDVVKKLHFDFLQYTNADLNKARQLLVETTEGFLKQVNHDNKLIPYMQHYPFNFNDVEIGITFHNKASGRRVTNQYIAFTFVQNGKIHYYTCDEKTNKLVDGPMETYAEAYKIVMGQDLPEAIVPAPSYLTATKD